MAIFPRAKTIIALQSNWPQTLGAFLNYFDVSYLCIIVPTYVGK